MAVVLRGPFLETPRSRVTAVITPRERARRACARVRRSAIRPLRRRGTARACGALRTVAEEHADAEVRERASVAAAQLGCG